MTKEASFSTRQAQFIKEYPIDLNGTQAAIRAGYSPKTADQQASRLLTNVKIKAAIQTELDKRSIRTEVTQDRVIKELARIAFLDIRQAFNKHGDLLAIPDMPEDVARAIGGMDISKWTDDDGGTETTKKVKLIDKKGALELLGKHLKLFTEKREISGPGGAPLHTITTEMPADEATELYRSILND